MHEFHSIYYMNVNKFKRFLKYDSCDIIGLNLNFLMVGSWI